MLRFTPGLLCLWWNGSLVFGQILHSREVKQAPLRPSNLSLHRSVIIGQRVNWGMFFARSLQAVQIKWDRPTEVTQDNVGVVRLFWHEVKVQVGLRQTEVDSKRAKVKTERKTFSPLWLPAFVGISLPHPCRALKQIKLKLLTSLSSYLLKKTRESNAVKSIKIHQTVKWSSLYSSCVCDGCS